MVNNLVFRWPRPLFFHRFWWEVMWWSSKHPPWVASPTWVASKSLRDSSNFRTSSGAKRHLESLVKRGRLFDEVESSLCGWGSKLLLSHRFPWWREFGSLWSLYTTKPPYAHDENPSHWLLIIFISLGRIPCFHMWATVQKSKVGDSHPTRQNPGNP